MSRWSNQSHKMTFSTVCKRVSQCLTSLIWSFTLNKEVLYIKSVTAWNYYQRSRKRKIISAWNEQLEHVMSRLFLRFFFLSVKTWKRPPCSRPVRLSFIFISECWGTGYGSENIHPNLQDIHYFSEVINMHTHLCTCRWKWILLQPEAGSSTDQWRINVCEYASRKEQMSGPPGIFFLPQMRLWRIHLCRQKKCFFWGFFFFLKINAVISVWI